MSADDKIKLTEVVIVGGAARLGLAAGDVRLISVDEIQELLVVDQAPGVPVPYQIVRNCVDPEPLNSLPSRRKRKGRGRHKAGRWGRQ